MNILVDSSLTSEQDWFKLIPLNFILDGENILDFNSTKHSRQINLASKKSTSFLSPEAVKKYLSKSDQNIIFTIPKSLSGQCNIYKKAHFANTLVVEGNCFLLFEDKVKEILNSNITLDEMKQQIEILNIQTIYEGLIISPTDLPKKGRISSFALNILGAFYIKVWIHFENGEWRNKTNFINIGKVLKKIIKGKKAVTVFTFDKETFIECKKLINLIDENIKVNYKRMSNAMIAHVGSGFIALA